jgi:hypothetical protein
MTTKTCVSILFKAMEKRKRDDKHTLRAKIGPWVKLIAPGLVDSIARKALQTNKQIPYLCNPSVDFDV